MKKWLAILKTFAPMIIATTVPGGAVIGPLVTHAIEEAESIQGATGAEKKAHTIAIVQDGIAGLNAGAGKVVVDPAAVTTTLSHGIDTAVGVTNMLHKQQTQNGVE